MFYTKFHSPGPVFYLPSSKCTGIGKQASVSFPHCTLRSQQYGQHLQAFSHSRADSRFAPSQWETALRCNYHDDVSHWLGASLESALNMADSRFAPSWWETVLCCNDVSHWLSASLESALNSFGHRIVLFLVKFQQCLIPRVQLTIIWQWSW